MKIAVDLRALVPEATGIGVYTREMLRRLAGPDPGHDFLGLAHRPIHHADELTAAGVEISPRTSRLPLGVLWQQLELPRWAARGGADLLWSPLQTLPITGALPGIVTVHDLTVLLFPETHRLKVRWSQLPFLERSLARARRIVAVSEATARDLRFHFPEAAPRVRVVPEGVDPAFRPAGEGEVATIRRQLGAPDGYLLYVGTLEPRKGVDTLLRAWERLWRERQGEAGGDPGGTKDPVPPLLLAGGTGWRNRPVRRRLRDLEPAGVRHLGRVSRSELVRLYQGASVFVFPSLYEGFGLPPLEAMACGVPVVTSDAASLPEVVGDAGVQVPARDSRALAQAVGRLLDEPGEARHRADRGLERAATFTWERAAAAMAEVLDEVARELA